MVIEGAGKFLRDLLRCRYRRSGKCEASMDRTLKKGKNSWYKETHVQQRSESEDESREENELVVVTGKDEESQKGGKLQMMRRVADETNLEH